MRCVCGHPVTSHRTVAMSVPLTARTPIYPIPGGGINSTRTGATYDQQVCACGCCSFEEL